MSLISGISLIGMGQMSGTRSRIKFADNWQFHLGEVDQAFQSGFNASDWRVLDVPHDWSIEGEFDDANPATVGGGALPGGIGWYRKAFTLDDADRGKKIFIDFDGVYMNSKVWINGQLLGERPYGYSSFRFDLTPYLKYGEEINEVAVRVDNSLQPNSRWYSGSGIYRNVWLVKTSPIYIPLWGTFLTTPEVQKDKAGINLKVKVVNKLDKAAEIEVVTKLINSKEENVKSMKSQLNLKAGEEKEISQEAEIAYPDLWSVSSPLMYVAETEILLNGKTVDLYSTPFGIRTFNFDSEKGFTLNGEAMKINGVCMHHDLGCLGSAINVRALERQLEILQGMGCNAIRTSHNPPAPELLDLCDKMGFLVMDEAFDMWKKSKNPYDYSLYWDEWHEKDLRDFILRDRNHPSIIAWSIGNEILEQWDSTGIPMVKELYSIVRELDTTRPITTANNPPSADNHLNKPMVLDLIGYNYAHGSYESFPEDFPGQKFIATETVSALATRGQYDMPSDSIRRWPRRWDEVFTAGNPDWTVSAYDHVSAPWGSTHEETWRIMKKHDYLSGMFIWTGFDYIGEPTPYTWPARSSYFGVVDLAGFPKDSYYMYKSEWTQEPVLHVFPHWNWTIGDTVDVWAYSGYDEVELFLNGRSQGTKRKQGDDMRVFWRLAFEPGLLKAVSRKNGQVVLSREVRTAEAAAKIVLTPDRQTINADGADLSFVTVKVVD
ncbi:MAG: glycoside hydrolase family 2 protein, partial [Bacteroidales bacterium]|nr:glycoside hydrolase family 2 protein [Bacteroidales bacterium]